SDEMTLLSYFGAAEPDLSATLSDRFEVVQNLIRTNPARKPFTRITSRPIPDTSLDVVLPRGSGTIECYMVVPLNAGAVEGAWPAAGDAAAAARRAAARRGPARPPPPGLSAIAADNGHVALVLRPRPGHPVSAVDVHRVGVIEATVTIGSMGPPIA